MHLGPLHNFLASSQSIYIITFSNGYCYNAALVELLMNKNYPKTLGNLQKKGTQK